MYLVYGELLANGTFTIAIDAAKDDLIGVISHCGGGGIEDGMKLT